MAVLGLSSFFECYRLLQITRRKNRPVILIGLILRTKKGILSLLEFDFGNSPDSVFGSFLAELSLDINISFNANFGCFFSGSSKELVVEIDLSASRRLSVDPVRAFA